MVSGVAILPSNRPWNSSCFLISAIIITTSLVRFSLSKLSISFSKFHSLSLARLSWSVVTKISLRNSLRIAKSVLTAWMLCFMNLVYALLSPTAEIVIPFSLSRLVISGKPVPLALSLVISSIVSGSRNPLIIHLNIRQSLYMFRLNSKAYKGRVLNSSMKYEPSITYAKFFTQMGYGVLAFVLTFALDFMVQLPPEMMTIELVVLMGVVRALDNYLKHK